MLAVAPLFRLANSNNAVIVDRIDSITDGLVHVLLLWLDVTLGPVSIVRDGALAISHPCHQEQQPTA